MMWYLRTILGQSALLSYITFHLPLLQLYRSFSTQCYAIPLSSIVGSELF